MAGQKRSILAVDDMPEILISLNEILGSEYEMHMAKSAKAAISILEKLKIDMILLDMDIPVVSGLDLLEVLQAKSDYKKIPVIMVSSNSQLMNVSRAIKLGARDYVVKPVNAMNLREKIYRLFVELKYGIQRESTASEHILDESELGLNESDQMLNESNEKPDETAPELNVSEQMPDESGQTSNEGM
jgi:PleD family two-component response regulator